MKVCLKMNNIKEPVFEINKSKVLEKYENLRKQNLIVSYSIKTNPLITSILEENTDSLFSVHFENELEFVKDKGKVIFLLQGTDEKFLKKLGILFLRLGMLRIIQINIFQLILIFFQKCRWIKINCFRNLNYSIRLY